MVLRLLAAQQDAGKVTVRIGHETEAEQMVSTSVVTTTYGSSDVVYGGMGVLGPTRMDYPGTIANVAADCDVHRRSPRNRWSDVRDYYGLLGVSRNASDAEIKRAYRKLARELHPRHQPRGGGAVQGGQHRLRGAVGSGEAPHRRPRR